MYHFKQCISLHNIPIAIEHDKKGSLKVNMFNVWNVFSSHLVYFMIFTDVYMVNCGVYEMEIEMRHIF